MNTTAEEGGGSRSPVLLPTLFLGSAGPVHPAGRPLTAESSPGRAFPTLLAPSPTLCLDSQPP